MQRELGVCPVCGLLDVPNKTLAITAEGEPDVLGRSSMTLTWRSVSAPVDPRSPLCWHRGQVQRAPLDEVAGRWLDAGAEVLVERLPLPPLVPREGRAVLETWRPPGR